MAVSEPQGEELAAGTPATSIAPPAEQLTMPGGTAKPTQRQKLGIWALCVVIASLLPIFGALAEGSVQAQSPGLVGILSRGDLYLIGAVITIGGVGDLGLSLISRPNITALFVLIPGVILAPYEGILYSEVATQLLTGKAVAHVGAVAMLSFTFFLASAVLGGIGVYMAAGE